MSSHTLYYNKPISRWDEALPIGKGIVGSLIWGDGAPFRLSLDRGDLWDTRVAVETQAEDYTYAELIRLVERKDQQAIEQRFDCFYSRSTPTKIPAGRLELNYGTAASQVESCLTLSDATASVKLIVKGKESCIRTFLHAETGLGYIHIRGEAPLPEISIIPPAFKDNQDTAQDEEPSAFNSKVSMLGYPDPELHSEGNVSWYLQRTCVELEFAIMMARRPVNSTEMTIVYTIVTNREASGWLENARMNITQAAEFGFEAAMITHRTWWQQFWNKSRLSLPDTEFEKQWYLSNYFLGSCSRKGCPPMPLQGVWTADEGLLPPWKGDYHHDLNTQLSYSHYLKANHLDEGQAFIDFLWGLLPEAREFARTFFDAPGICFPSVMSIDAKSLGGWPMYSTNLVNQIWLCQSFDHYWQYTGDTGFLQEKAYVFFKETAACVGRWLRKGEDGKLILPLSSSPEIHDNRIESWLTPNSNNDLALLIYLFRTLSKMADIQGLQQEADQWREMLIRLPELAVNENHVLMLSPDESLKESHRHLSHAMAIYPLRLMDYKGSERERQIIDATILDLEKLGKGEWIGFTYPWMANLYIQQGNGEAAYYHLKLFWENFCSPNGFHLNGDYKKRGISKFHYRPFTLEANMAAADALQEMLLQHQDGIIRVFPSIPEHWRAKDVSFQDFRGGRGVLVSADIQNGELRSVVLKAERSGTIAVQNAFKRDWLIMTVDGAEKKVACDLDAVIQVELSENQICVLT